MDGKMDTYPMSSDKVTVGWSTHARMIDELEKQIYLRDEKIIKANQEILKLSKALDRACNWLELFDKTETGCKASEFKKDLLKEVKDE